MNRIKINESPRITIVFPVFNEEDNLETLYSQVRENCAIANVDYEMIFVDDGSTDGSLKLIKNLIRQDNKVVYISLSRNFGHQNAIFAGLSYAKGDAVIAMDADLQHPPSLIPKMIQLWREGGEVVYTIKKSIDIPFLEYWIFKAFYWFLSKVSGLKLSFGQSDFRLLDKKVLKVILDIPEYHKFLRGQVEWVGFQQKPLFYDADRRYRGKSKFFCRNRFSFALDGIFAFSEYPLRLITAIGIFVAATTLLYTFYIIVIWILYKLNIYNKLVLVQGWTTLLVVISFLGSLQLIAVGVLGEYVGRIFNQIKGRPVFIIRESSEKPNEEVMID